MHSSNMEMRWTISLRMTDTVQKYRMFYIQLRLGLVIGVGVGTWCWCLVRFRIMQPPHPPPPKKPSNIAVSLLICLTIWNLYSDTDKHNVRFHFSTCSCTRSCTCHWSLLSIPLHTSCHHTETDLVYAFGIPCRSWNYGVLFRFA